MKPLTSLTRIERAAAARDLAAADDDEYLRLFDAILDAHGEEEALIVARAANEIIAASAPQSWDEC